MPPSLLIQTMREGNLKKERRRKKKKKRGREGGNDQKKETSARARRVGARGKEKAGLIRRESRLEEVVRSNGIQHR